MSLFPPGCPLVSRGRTWGPPAALVVLLLAGALLGLACTPNRERDEEASRSSRGRPVPHPVIVVGIDGATWDVIDPMIARGELPHFEDLRRRGVYGRLISVQPYSSPVVWTTVATGRFPREHQILDHVYPYTGGKKRPVRSTLRMAPALWNIASRFDVSVGSVGWFVTHPPEEVEGFMISDRAGQGVTSSVYPKELEAEVAEVLSELRSQDTRREILREFIPWDYDASVLEERTHLRHHATRVVHNRVDRRSIEDEFVRRMTLRLLTLKPDLFLSYFRMVDHASHASWLYFDPRDFEDQPNPGDRELLQDLIPASYRFMDRVLGEIGELAGDTANVVVLSDHGFGSATGSYSGPSDMSDIITGNHRPDGILLAAGPAIDSGPLEGMTIVDAAPTMLALLGLPLSAELPGQVVEDFFRPGFLEQHPVRTVPAYRISWTQSGDDTVSPDAERESLETLRSLGYIGGGTELAAEDDGAMAGDFWQASRRLKGRAIVGEMVYYLLRGQTHEAITLRRLVQRGAPELGDSLERQVTKEVRLLEDKLQRPMVEPTDLAAVFREGVLEEPGAAVDPGAGEPPP